MELIAPQSYPEHHGHHERSCSSPSTLTLPLSASVNGSKGPIDSGTTTEGQSHSELHRSKSASAYSYIMRKRRSGSRPFRLTDTEFLEEHAVSSLQLGVMDACQQLEANLREIHVSEVLPAAPDIMFLNVTTLEGQPFCLERTGRGWRICSTKHDSMHGDLHYLDLHVLYFQDAAEALARVSPAFQKVLEEVEQAERETLQFE